MAMGVRYVNAAYLKDAVIDIGRPQAVLYEPLPDGKLTLVGVKYMTFSGPASLDGQTFGFVGAPNQYDLPAFYELPVCGPAPATAEAPTSRSPFHACANAISATMPAVLITAMPRKARWPYSA